MLNICPLYLYHFHDPVSASGLIVWRVLFPHWCSRIKVAVHISSSDQMPSLKMKHNLSMHCLKEKYGLHVCQKSSKVSKKSCSYVRITEQTAEFDTCIHKCQDGEQLHLRFFSLKQCVVYLIWRFQVLYYWLSTDRYPV